MKRIPLTKSLGISSPSDLTNMLSDEYMEQYQHVVRASGESFENFENVKERPQIETDGEESDESDPLPRRRSSGLKSDITIRRARSQAERRTKLNSQSLKSHRQHTRNIRGQLNLLPDASTDDETKNK